jgi:hypothetical protein
MGAFWIEMGVLWSYGRLKGLWMMVSKKEMVYKEEGLGWQVSLMFRLGSGLERGWVLWDVVVDAVRSPVISAGVLD